jgi:hypothetical protein
VKTRVVAQLAAATLCVGLGVLIGRASVSIGRPEATPVPIPIPVPGLGPGPSRTVGGVPVGFQQSEEGAVAAAAAFSRTVDAAVFATPKERRKALATITTEESRRDVTKATEAIARVVAKGYGPKGSGQKIVSRGAFLGYRVVSYTADSALVELWGVGIAGRAGGPNPKGGWGTSTVALRWVQGDWRLAGVIEAREGPTPEATGRPTPAAQFVVEASRFREVDNRAAS